MSPEGDDAVRSIATARLANPLLVGGEHLRQRVDRSLSGGPKFDPLNLDDARNLLRPKVVALVEQAREVPDHLRGARLIVEATLWPNYLANSYFPTALVEHADFVPIGVRTATATYRTRTREIEAQPTKTLILAASDDSIGRLEGLIEQRQASRTGAAAQQMLVRLADISLPQPSLVLRDPTAKAETWEAVLHPDVSAGPRSLRAQPATTFAKFVRWIEQLEGTVESQYRRVVGGLTFVPVRLAPQRIAEAARFNPLRAIRPMPQIRPLPQMTLRAARTIPSPPVAPGPKSPIRIAVFDGGANQDDPHFRNFVRAFDLTTEPAAQEYSGHGSFVTSALLYGHFDGGLLGVPPASVDHYRVFPVPKPEAHDVELYWVLDRVRETLEAVDYDLVNLSFGPDTTVDSDGEPTRWTAELDELAYERSITINVAAGNNGEADPALKLNRVQVPSDLINGLGIGACDSLAPAAWSRAPYSPVGPGRAGGRVRPVGLAFGGVATTPFVAVHGGRLWESTGTSFSTPLVARALAELGGYLGPRHKFANTLRAFAIHFADNTGGSPIEEVGHGRFQHALGQILSCASHEVTVLYEDQLERDETVSFALPWPKAIKTGIVDIHWTLVTTTAVDPKDAVEYARYGIDFHFRPNAAMRSYVDPDTKKVRSINIETETARFKELLRRGIVPSINPPTRSMSMLKPEFQRRDEGKWETVRDVRESLRASSLHFPRLDLAFLARETGMLTATAAPLPFTLLVTMRARNPRQRVYESVRSEYKVLTPLEVQVEIEA